MAKFFSLLFLLLVVLGIGPGIARAAVTGAVKTIVGDLNTTDGGFKFYCQYNRDYYTSSCDIPGWGCNPTSLAMIMSTSLGKKYTPTYVSSHVVEPATGNHIGCARPGTSFQGMLRAKTWAENQGMTSRGSLVYSGQRGGSISLTRVKEYTDKGFLLYSGAYLPFKCSSLTSCTKIDGHAFVIYGANPANNTLLYYDPTYCQGGRSDKAIPQTININKIITWYFAYPMK